MKLQLTSILSFLALGSILSAQSIFNGYAYVSDTTAGASPTWYNLNGSAQSSSFNGIDLGDFSTNLWLGGQTGFWSDGQGVEYIRMGYNISGAATATGFVNYSFQSFSSPNDQWGTDVNGSVTSDQSTDLIAAHSLAAGDYNISIYVEGKANNRSSIYDSNGGSNYNATFTVVPESSTIALIAGSLCFAYVMLRRRLS